FDLKDLPDLTKKTVDGYILHSNLSYENGNYEDYGLWEAFREDFEGWKTEIFLLANTKIRRVFRNFLLRHGVYFQRNGQKIAETLSNVVNNETYHQWTSIKVKDYMKTTKKFFSRFNLERSSQSKMSSKIEPQKIETFQAKKSVSQLKQEAGMDGAFSSQIQIGLSNVNITNLPPYNRESSLPPATATKLLIELAKVYQENS
ncbi:hypothetical protein GcM1_228058, partial [Golovinomyces cichoracearum]